MADKVCNDSRRHLQHAACCRSRGRRCAAPSCLCLILCSRHCRLDLGDAPYAPNTLVNDDGRHLMWVWIQVRVSGGILCVAPATHAPQPCAYPPDCSTNPFWSACLLSAGIRPFVSFLYCSGESGCKSGGSCCPGAPQQERRRVQLRRLHERAAGAAHPVCAPVTPAQRAASAALCTSKLLCTSSETCFCLLSALVQGFVKSVTCKVMSSQVRRARVTDSFCWLHVAGMGASCSGRCANWTPCTANTPSPRYDSSAGCLHCLPSRLRPAV